MAERFNGNASFRRKNHGSDRRGVFPVPSIDAVNAQLNQSQRDRQRLLERIHTLRQESLTQLVQDEGLGNKDLPAFKHKQEILEILESHRAIILGGPTGSGKSTQVPQFLYEAGYEKVFVLVPRRIIADGLGERIQEELSEQLKEEADNAVGIIHGERRDTHEDNRILVMTPDTFNSMESDINSEYKDKKVAIISDEIHEANLFTEIATGIAATSVMKNENWRLIAASATHNAETLQAPFRRINGADIVPSVNIDGRPFSVELREAPEQTPMEAYAAIGHEHEKSMIFTSGKKEIDYIIDRTFEEIANEDEAAAQQVVFRKLHGELTEFELSHINDPIPEGYRLVIVASPAGMSGITIPGVTLVITDGTINRSELDDDGISGLSRHYLSQAGITQQIGRAGRDVPGGIGILAKPITILEDSLRARKQEIPEPHMPFVPFKERGDHEPPEIYQSNLGRVVLRVASLNRRFTDINEFIPHRVAQSAIINTEESLYRIGALNEDDAVTPVGISMNEFPLSPELSRGVTEVRHSDRALQQRARAALIAVAVDVGGIQNFGVRTREWQKLLRPSTTDDFMAQLDLMTAVVSSDTQKGSLEEAYFLSEYDLHPKKVERARKAARKVMNILRIDLDNVILTPPLPDEETLLRRDFTAGMIDLVYEEASRHHKKVFYKNIHGDPSATERFISGRSVAKPRDGQLVAAIPRWYEKRDRSGIRRYDVIEQTLFVDPRTVGQFAEANGLLTGRALNPRIDGDMVVEREQRMFGSIPVGEPVTSSRKEYIPEMAQKLLVKQALEQPKDAQEAMRTIADELSHYRATIPEEDLATYLRSNAPEEVTKQRIESLLKEFAKTTRSLVELDRLLAGYMYSKNITINRYFDDEARLELQARSPAYLAIAGHDTRLFYDKGQPYVTQLTREQKKALSSQVYLPDGREVLLQISRGLEKVRVSLTAQ